MDEVELTVTTMRLPDGLAAAAAAERDALEDEVGPELLEPILQASADLLLYGRVSDETKDAVRAGLFAKHARERATRKLEPRHEPPNTMSVSASAFPPAMIERVAARLGARVGEFGKDFLTNQKTVVRPDDLSFTDFSTALVAEHLKVEARRDRVREAIQRAQGG